MSGPKGLTTVQFNAILQSILNYQDDLLANWQRLLQFNITDSERGIEIDNADFIRDNEATYKELAKAVNIPSGKNSGATRGYVERLQKAHQKFAQAVAAAESQMDASQNDYDSYLEYEAFYNNTVAGYNEYVDSSREFYDAHIKDKNPDLYAEFTQALAGLAEFAPAEQFFHGFRKRAGEFLSDIEQLVADREELLHRLRTKASDKALADLPKGKQKKGSGLLSRVAFFPKNKNIAALAASLDKTIHAMAAGPTKSHYEDRFKTILVSEIFSGEAYYFNELKDEIENDRKRAKWVAELKKLLQALGKVDTGELTSTISEALLSAIDNDRLKKNEYERLVAKTKKQLKELKSAAKQKRIQKRQQTLLKQEVVEALEAMHYKTLSDMEVVDFEKQTDFVLKAPKSDDYINLRFSPTGGFIYNFLIENDVDKLSIDELKNKLATMDKACADFKKALAELKNMGIDINIDKELPVNKESLLKAPAKVLKKIRAFKSRVQKKIAAQPKKKYLDR